jgi:hypothetical protein
MSKKLHIFLPLASTVGYHEQSRFLNIKKSTAESPLLFMVICHKSHIDVSGSNVKEEGKQISVVSEGMREREVIPWVNIETHKIFLVPFV